MWPFKRKEQVVEHRHEFVNKGERFERILEENQYAVKKQDWQRFICISCGTEIEAPAGYMSAVSAWELRHSYLARPISPHFGPYWSESSPYWVAKK